MAASQSRIADTIDKFYGSADRTSEGAMAANAYKRSIDELDTSINRELVCKMMFTSSLV
jgi:bridging integrator 3